MLNGIDLLHSNITVVNMIIWVYFTSPQCTLISPTCCIIKILRANVSYCGLNTIARTLSTNCKLPVLTSKSVSISL